MNEKELRAAIILTQQRIKTNPLNERLDKIILHLLREKQKVFSGKDLEELNVPFSWFWDTYDKKRNKKVCERLWLQLSNNERSQVKANLPLYLAVSKETTYRMDPERYLKNKRWLDEYEQKQQFKRNWNR